tara:strand:- start:637 stop:753 length:117 start_codon:yes stop_codon:yes gene_type:complete
MKKIKIFIKKHKNELMFVVHLLTIGILALIAVVLIEKI